MKFGREFFVRKPEVVAKDLLGKFLVHKTKEKTWVGKIVETEAYLGLGDKASHSHTGITSRNEVMFGPAGFSYIYFTYGMHWLLNIITEEEGKPSGVLIRALEPLTEEDKKLASGPAKLTKWMQIDGNLNKVDITKSEELFITEEISVGNQIYRAEKITLKNINAVPRVGVDYAAEHKNLLLRFYIKDSRSISKK